MEQAQSLLSLAGHPLIPDGRFGPETTQATATYQGEVGLAADGVIGRRTAVALDGVGVLWAATQRSNGVREDAEDPEWASPPQETSGRETAKPPRSASKDANPPAPKQRPAQETPANGTPAPSMASPALSAAVSAVIARLPEAMKEHGRAVVPMILSSCLSQNLRDPRQVAYILATAEHESGFGQTKYSRSEYLVEDHNPYKRGTDGRWSAKNHMTGRRLTAGSEAELEQVYWDSLYGKGKSLGNRPGTSDGADFKGRGFVQLTGRRNYADMSRRLTTAGISYTHEGVTYGAGGQPIDLVANPTHVNKVPELAAHILVLGSAQGAFTGRSLDRYITGDKADFYNARAVINGDKEENGIKIANLAEGFAAALKRTWPAVFERPGA